MNEQSYFHWDLFRPPIHSPSFAMGASFLDIREEAMRGLPGKPKPFSFDQSCALWSKDLGLDPTEGLPNVGGRVLEIRKEKSRDAARSRRGKENYEFYELAKLLPLPAAITSQLDKASIIRLSISYLKLRDFCGHGDPPWTVDGHSTNKNVKGSQRRNSSLSGDLFDIHQGAHILQSLDGFAFALSNDGRLLYISETVSIYLGLSQVEMAGSSLFDYIHSQDHQELADQLGISLASVSSTLSSPASPSVDSPTTPRAITPPVSDRVPIMSPNLEKTADRSFCIRMKSTLTKRGVHSRSSGYRVVLIVGQFRPQINYSIGRKCPGPLLGLSGVAIALPPPTITELRIEADTFIMRLTAQFKVIYCENVISTLTDWKCDDVIGKDLYEFCHPADAHHLKKLHKDLLMKGQVMSPSIRLLNKGGGYIWLCVCCTSLYSSKTSDDQTVLAIFQTISIEHRGVAMDSSQLPYTDHQHVAAHGNTNEDIDHVISEDLSPASHTSDRSLVSKLSGHNSPDIVANSDKIASPEPSSVFPSGIDNDFLLDENIENESEPVKHDNKMSRRKADRPRKRKRGIDDSPSVSSILETLDNQGKASCVSERTSNISDTVDGSVLNLSSVHHSFPSSPEQDMSTKPPSQQIPEDLSLRSDGEKRLDANSPVKNDSKSVSKPNTIVSSSVHELEKAMNRHLPPNKKTFPVCDEDNLHSTQSQKSAIHWSGSSNSGHLQTSLSSPFYVSNLYTSRESVIRSSLRSHVLNGDSNVINMLSPSSGEVTIHKDQLQLHIPHITVNTKQNFQTHKNVPLTDEFNMTPPDSVSPQDKMASAYSDNPNARDCMGMRIGQRHDVGNTSNKSFAMVNDSGNDVSKTQFLSVPNYQYHSSELGSFSHGQMTSGGLLFDPRSSPTNAWYGSTYNS
ncbi:protein trachealess-like isoform X2 [Ruditapes philippinarum]|uniref:protein trachealess-like isoform X2 n=1 Tax=Ruditapes philippinarum TaxID=129788 RepID=UPI00295B134A|nr:protein trachealess-like isoform X2 [Ruditapes philippinarum]